MTNPQQPENWSDPTWQVQQPAAYPDPVYHTSGQPVEQPTAIEGQPMAAYPSYGYPPAPAFRPTNGMAIAALVLSLVGIGSCITAPIGAILGHVARRQIRERGESGDGMALAGIIVGWIFTGLFLLFLAVYVVIIVIAITAESGNS